MLQKERLEFYLNSFSGHYHSTNLSLSFGLSVRVLLMLETIMCATEQELNVVGVGGSSSFNSRRWIYFNNVIDKND